MDHLLNHMEELLELRISGLIIKTREKQERSVLERKIGRMETIMDQLSQDDKEWLDNELVDIGCSKEDDDKSIYKTGFCDSLKIMKLLGI